MIDARMIDAVVFISNVKATHPLLGAIFNEGVMGYNDHKNQLLSG